MACTYPGQSGKNNNPKESRKGSRKRQKPEGTNGKSPEGRLKPNHINNYIKYKRTKSSNEEEKIARLDNEARFNNMLSKRHILNIKTQTG